MSQSDKLPKILPPKSDIVFKMLFGDERNVDLLISLLEAILNVKIDSVTLLDTVLKPEHIDDKKCILDVKAELSGGERINIEIQVKNIKEMRSRITHYNNRLVAEQIGDSGDYSAIKPAISIIIIDYPLIHESEKCHNVFSMLEKDEHFPFNDLQEIHILHLCRIDMEKMPKVADWLSFISSDKEEDFMILAEKNQTLSRAFERLKVISADEESRIIYEARLKEQRDTRAEISTARWEGKIEGKIEGRIEGKIEAAQEMIQFLKSGHTLEEAEKMFLLNQ
ncbi:MAG: Rpn family recombination-promoting nuclease/putative transposase [Chitinispirillales bacterium]|jgi:predicted transposase/invertase (TIGR01784 family)|nr:Rpn family recombination-promoting nuclease/putative transposase [Chitinispirillales bacterium]